MWTEEGILPIQICLISIWARNPFILSVSGFQQQNNGGQSVSVRCQLPCYLVPAKQHKCMKNIGTRQKIRQKSILPPPTITKVWFSSYNYKTGYFTSLNFSNRAFYLPRAVLKTVCYSNRGFVFFFLKKISVESLKNHSKLQKIIK